MPPPLGTDPSRFLQIDEQVESNSALLMAPARWDDYQDRIRPQSVVHVITLTDDESLISAECLLIRMEEKLGADHDFRLHTISSEAVGIDPPTADEVRRGGDRGTECKLAFRWQDNDYMACEGADRAGREYWRASAATGGVATSVCAADWSAVFDQISEAVQRESAFGCEVELPEVPDGATFDPSEIKLSATREGQTVEVARVQSADGCGDTDEGWYLQSASTKAVLCPQTCNDYASAGASLSLDMGCAWRIR